MEHFRNVDQNAFVAAFEEMRGLVSDRRGSLLCPKPRRCFGASSVNPLTRIPQTEALDSKARRDLLDLFLTEEEPEPPLMTSVTFFSGSPPQRADNPLIHDPCFNTERIDPSMPMPTNDSHSDYPSSPPSARVGCIRMKFGLNPAAVRVEGFDCLNRDGQSSSITSAA